MSTKNADMAATPTNASLGLTKRERFCLEMRVPKTGDPELDDIIREGNLRSLYQNVFLSRGHSIDATDVFSNTLKEAKKTLKDFEDRVPDDAEYLYDRWSRASKASQKG